MYNLLAKNIKQKNLLAFCILCVFLTLKLGDKVISIYDIWTPCDKLDFLKNINQSKHNAHGTKRNHLPCLTYMGINVNTVFFASCVVIGAQHPDLEETELRVFRSKNVLDLKIGLVKLVGEVGHSHLYLDS